MSRLLLGSINLTELSAKIKSGEIDVFTSEKTGGGSNAPHVNKDCLDFLND